MTRFVRFASIAAVLAGLLAAVRAMRRPGDPLPTPASSPSEPWPPLRGDNTPASSEPAWTPDAAPAPNTPDPDAEAPEADTPTAGGGAAWTEPTADGGCPDGFPIKAKMSSKIFHAPGQLNYDRTTPDRCYADAAAAEADGLRAAKR